MLSGVSHEDPILVFDTCTEAATAALFAGSDLLEEVHLPGRAASTALFGTIRDLLQRYSLYLAQLGGIGVVSGPGSFTGVRIGLAAAKGLCEASGRPLGAVSRLKVLADASQLSDGLVLLGAGRDQVYARELHADGADREWLSSLDDLKPCLHGRTVGVGSRELVAMLADTGATIRYRELSAKQAIAEVQRCLASGGSDLVLADANYVRNEAAIYAKSAASL